MSCLEQKIRETRDKKNLLIRQVATHIEVNTSLMINAEQCERNLNRNQDVKLARFFNTSEEEYISLWLCYKLIEVVDNDPLATQSIKKALTKNKN